MSPLKNYLHFSYGPSTHSYPILFNNTLLMVLVQSYRYWQQILPVHICSTLNWHNIHPYQPLRTYQHHSTSLPLMSPSTSAHIIHLPVAQHSIPPAPRHSNSLSSPFQHHHLFFSDPLPALIPSPHTNLPPPSVYLCLKPSYPSLSPTHSLCYFVVPSACTEWNRKYYLAIWLHSHLSVFVCGCVSLRVCVDVMV